MIKIRASFEVFFSIIGIFVKTKIDRFAKNV